MPAGRSTGKWLRSDVPKSGWTCNAIDQLNDEDDAERCEMCESQDIKTIHVMAHPDVAATLRVGKVCAGHMEGDLAAAESRQSNFDRQSAWLARRWRGSERARSYVVEAGYRVEVTYSLWGYTVRVSHADSGRVVEPPTKLVDYDKARLLGLAVMQELIDATAWV